MNTRLHDAPVFNVYIPNNEKVRNNVIYKGAIKWKAQKLDARNLDFKDFKNLPKRVLQM